jgi:hypothetical protein
MKTYSVKKHYSEYYYCNIEAEDYEDAKIKAELIDRLICHKDEYTDWLVLDIKELQPELSASDLAFMAAYQSAVGNAPKEIVKLWLQHKDHDKFYEDYSEYYASITDAYEIWLMAQSFIKENSK